MCFNTMENQEKQWIQRVAELPNRSQMHLRPAQMIMEEAQKFQADIRLFIEGCREEDSGGWNPKSLLETMFFAAEMAKASSPNFYIKASGVDEEQAVSSLADLMKNRLSEAS